MQEREHPPVRGYGCGTTYDDSLESPNTAGDSDQFAAGEKDGYTQTQRNIDERIRHEVCRTLSEDDQLDASEVVVTVADHEVTLQGRVVDQRSKYRAEDLVARVSGVRAVHNRAKTETTFLDEVAASVAGKDSEDTGPMEHHAGDGPKACVTSSPLHPPEKG